MRRMQKRGRTVELTSSAWTNKEMNHETATKAAKNSNWRTNSMMIQGIKYPAASLQAPTKSSRHTRKNTPLKIKAPTKMLLTAIGIKMIG